MYLVLNFVCRFIVVISLFNFSIFLKNEIKYKKIRHLLSFCAIMFLDDQKHIRVFIEKFKCIKIKNVHIGSYRQK